MICRRGQTRICIDSILKPCLILTSYQLFGYLLIDKWWLLNLTSWYHCLWPQQGMSQWPQPGTYKNYHIPPENHHAYVPICQNVDWNDHIVSGWRSYSGLSLWDVHVLLDNGSLLSCPTGHQGALIWMNTIMTAEGTRAKMAHNLFLQNTCLILTEEHEENSQRKYSSMTTTNRLGMKTVRENIVLWLQQSEKI